MVQDTLVRVEAVVPYRKGDLLDVIHRLGVVESEVSALATSSSMQADRTVVREQGPATCLHVSKLKHRQGWPHPRLLWLPQEYLEQGTLVHAYVPLSLSRKLMPFRSEVQKLEPRL